MNSIGQGKFYEKSEDSRLRIKIYLKNKWLGLLNLFDISMVFRISMFKLPNCNWLEIDNIEWLNLSQFSLCIEVNIKCCLFRMSDLGVEINRLLERCLRESRCLDTESLCIISGEKVSSWEHRLKYNVVFLHTLVTLSLLTVGTFVLMNFYQSEKCYFHCKVIVIDSKSWDGQSKMKWILKFGLVSQVWQIRVDVNVMNHDGNIIDCSSIAAIAALAHFRWTYIMTIMFSSIVDSHSVTHF